MEANNPHRTRRTMRRLVATTLTIAASMHVPVDGNADATGHSATYLDMGIGTPYSGSDDVHDFLIALGKYPLASSRQQTRHLQGSTPLMKSTQEGGLRELVIPGGGGTSWKSCLDYSCDDLESIWMFDGAMPTCPGYESLYGTSCGSSGGGSGGGGGGGGSGSSGGGSGSGSGSGSYYSSGNDGDGSSNSSGNDGDGSSNSSENDGDGSYYSGGNGNGGGNSSSNVDNNGNNGSYGNYGNYNDDYIPDPYDDFDINECSSYSDYWLWDLAITCESYDSFENCQCSTAQALFDDGALSCPGESEDSPYCPDDCAICHSCLRMLACSKTKAPKTISKYISKSFPYVIAMAGAVFVVGAAVYAHSLRSKGRRDRMIQLTSPLTPREEPVWLAPMPS